MQQADAATTVIINADDWGDRAAATDRILDCLLRSSISSTSAMVFMADSERAAGLARQHNVDAGLHLNLTAPFTAARVPTALTVHQERIARFLRKGRFAPMKFHPLLISSFEYAVRTQVDEFARLYGAQPNRVDGHHHAHLCANVQWQKLIPRGIMVRRNFTFRAGEKGGLNRFYRGMQDRNLARRYRIADFFFNLMPLEEGRLREILKVAGHAIVEIECHPERDQEYEFLMQGRLKELGRVHVSRGYVLRRSDGTARQARGESDHSPGNAIDMSGAAPGGRIPHISVCICTYMRPQPLKRLLGELDRQKTDGLFAYSAVVADNDEARSGEAAINEIREALSFPVKYCVEPQRGIARARNRVLANAEGDYVALIDDDEFPVEDWLLRLLLTLCRYDVDGVLGPVKRYFDGDPPSWLKRSRLYDRAVNPTGMPAAWRKARTGNVLLKWEVFSGDEAPFNVEFKSGEDHDFFRRKELEGCSFVWSAEAITYEVLPPARWTRSYYVRKAFLHGGYAAMQPDCGAVSIIKSLIAVPLYSLALPFSLVAGQHRFMALLVKLCDHAGKLLFLVGIRPIHEEYVSD
ncbi:MAG: ChbG/HpnK family deacetylase [Terracidiphilus sp.]